MNEDLLFYKSEYCGKLSDEDFKRLYNRTLLSLKRLIFYRDVPAEMKTQFRMALCEMIDSEARAEINGASLTARNVKSESVDGYSVEYGDISTATRKSLAITEYAIARNYLTAPVNLMYCGVG